MTLSSDLRRLDPLTMDLWGCAVVSVRWHLWRAGSEKAVCGVAWPADFWDVKREQPAADRCCPDCLAAASPTGAPR